jgi:hypothetical protein
MTANKYSNGNPKVPSIWSVIPSKRVVDIRSKKNPTTFLLFCLLAAYTNRAGTSFPSQALLSKQLGISVQAVSYHIRKLISWDYIRYAKKHSGLKGNKYYMVFDEAISEEEARAVQTSETISEIAEVIPPDYKQEPKAMEKNKFNTSSEARKICMQYRKIVEEIFGHQVQHKLDHEHLVDTWLKDFSKDYILKRIRNTIQYRRDSGKDSIKSIGYFKNVFVKNANKKPSSKKEELDQLLGKFKANHKIKF